MGLAVLANLTAYDFAYLTAQQLLERTSNAFRTMVSLERHRGHFYNWYDTRTLRPLLPMYVSTVDSGNLASYVLTLRAGLLALPDDPIPSRRAFAGLADTLDVLQESIGADAGAALAALRQEARARSLAPCRSAMRSGDSTGWRSSPARYRSPMPATTCATRRPTLPDLGLGRDAAATVSSPP